MHIVLFRFKIHLRWFLHGSSVHLEGYFIFCSGLSFPVRWNRINFGVIVKAFLVPKSGIVMNKDTAIPGAFKWAGTPMETLAALIE